MNKRSIFLALIILSCGFLANSQKDSTITITSDVVLIDSLSLINSLLDTVFVMDSTCERGTLNADFIFVVCSTISSGTTFLTIVDGACLYTAQYEFDKYSVKGISYYRDKRILWFNELPPQELLCHNTGQQESFSFDDDLLLVIRDNLPRTYCFYYDRQISIYKRTGCVDFEHSYIFPIILH